MKYGLPLPVLVPSVPEISDWLHLLEIPYSKRFFTNSGVLARNAESRIVANLGSSTEAIVCSNNTVGLIASLLSFNCRGKKILLSNYTFPATLNAVLAAGAQPVLSDIDEDSWEISAQSITRALRIHSDLHAVLLTRVHGFRRDLSPIIEICLDRNIPLILDSAAAFPALPENKAKENSESYFVEVFSFHATKPLGIGEGGAVVGPISLIESIRKSVNFGFKDGNFNFSDGLNAKMDEFAAARLIAALEKFEEIARKRISFVNELMNVIRNSDLFVLASNPGNTSWPFLPVLFYSESALLAFIEQTKNVFQTRRYYFPSILEGYQGGAKLLQIDNLSISRSIARRTLCLPVIPSLEKDEREIYFGALMNFSAKP